MAMKFIIVVFLAYLGAFVFAQGKYSHPALQAIHLIIYRNHGRTQGSGKRTLSAEPPRW